MAAFVSRKSVGFHTALPLLSCILLFSLYACAKPSPSTIAKQFVEFSSATTATTSNILSAYQLANIVQTKAMTIDITLHFGEHGYRIGDSLKRMTFVKPDQLAVRMLVINGLNAYALLLVDITGTDKYADLDTKISELGAALTDVAKNNLLSSFLDTSKIDLGKASTAVSELGQWLMQAQVRKVTAETLDKMRDPIDDICKMLASEIGSCPGEPGLRKAGICSEVSNRYTVMLDDYITYIHTLKLPLDKRKAEVEKLVAFKSEQELAKMTLAMTRDSIEKFKRANAQLPAALDKSSDTLRQLLAELVAEAAAIKSYYAKLQ